MIWSVEEIMIQPGFQKETQESLRIKLDAIEKKIRSYTNNRFQNINVRFFAESKGNCLNGVHPFLRVGDTVEIGESMVNDGLYVVTAIEDGKTKLDKELFEVKRNMVTKVEYPDDVKAGVLNLMTWEAGNGKKVGVKSETLSRHSVTYFDQDSNNTIIGYPAALVGFLKPYRKARI